MCWKLSFYFAKGFHWIHSLFLSSLKLLLELCRKRHLYVCIAEGLHWIHMTLVLCLVTITHWSYFYKCVKYGPEGPFWRSFIILIIGQNSGFCLLSERGYHCTHLKPFQSLLLPLLEMCKIWAPVKGPVGPNLPWTYLGDYWADFYYSKAKWKPFVPTCAFGEFSSRAPRGPRKGP